MIWIPIVGFCVMLVADKDLRSALLRFLEAVVGLCVILRAPVFCSAILSLAIYYPDQVSEYITMFSEQIANARSRGGWDRFSYLPIVASFYLLTILILLYCYELVAAALDRDRIGLMARYRFLFPFVAVPFSALPIAAARASAVNAAKVLEQQKLTSTNLVAVIDTHIWILAVITVAIASLCSYSIFLNRRTNRFWPARNLIYFKILPGFSAILYFYLAAIAATTPDAFSRLGPITLVCVIATVFLVTFSTITFYADHYPAPSTLILLLFFVFCNVTGLAGEWAVVRYPKELLSSSPEAPIKTPDYSNSIERAREWLEEKIATDGNTVDIFIVTAQGGGIYSAYHAAKLLARLTSINPSFSERLFAVSGVSGGAIGAAIYDTLLLRATKHSFGSDDAALCRRHAYWMKQEQLIDKFFELDLLSPILGYGATLDVARQFGVHRIVEGIGRLANEASLTRGVPDRSEALRRSISRSLSRLALDNGPGNSEIAVPLIGTWRTLARTPAMFFNVTSVSSGNRLYLSPFSLEQNLPLEADRAVSERRWFWTVMAASQIDVLTAAVMSARFPLITPPAMIESDEDGIVSRNQRRYVDGGYFDNSGLATAVDILSLLESAHSQIAPQISAVKKFRVNVLATTLTGRAANYGREPRNFVEVRSPLEAFDNARIARGLEMVKEAKNYSSDGLEVVFHEMSIHDDLRTLPLGWAMSGATRRTIQRSVDANLASLRSCPDGPYCNTEPKCDTMLR